MVICPALTRICFNLLRWDPKKPPKDEIRLICSAYTLANWKSRYFNCNKKPAKQRIKAIRSGKGVSSVIGLSVVGWLDG